MILNADAAVNPSASAPGDAALERMAYLQQLPTLTAAEQAELASLEGQLLGTYLSTSDDMTSGEEPLAEPLDQALLQELIQLAAHDELQQAVAQQLQAQKRADTLNSNAFPLPTIAWRLTADGLVEEYRLLYRSQPRPCLAALRSSKDARMKGLLARTKRFVLDLPTAPVDEWQAHQYGIPTNAAMCREAALILLDRWSAQYAHDRGARQAALKMIPSWSAFVDKDLTPACRQLMVERAQGWELQRAYGLLRLEDRLDTEGLTAVDATVLGRARYAVEELSPDGRLKKVFVQRVEGIDSTVITGVDRRLVGPDGVYRDISMLPYMPLYFSTSGTIAERPDYREVYTLPQTPSEMDVISRILGYGRWKSDGASFAVPSDDTRRGWTQEFQMRAARQEALAKGVVVPVRRDYVARRIQAFHTWLDGQFARAEQLDREAGRYVRVAYETRHAKPRSAWHFLRVAKSLRAEAAEVFLRASQWKRISPPAIETLEAMVRLSDGRDVTTLVRKDQIKVGHKQAERGIYDLAGTFLRGKVYRMRFNSQGIQLLSNEATPLLGRFVRRAVEEQCYFPLLTPEGIASVVDSQIGYLRMIADQAEYAGVLEDDELTSLPDTMRTLENLDTLRHALLSSAVRHTSEGKETRLLGYPIEERQVRLAGIGLKRLLDSVWASLIREVLRSWGITMRGGLLLTCENSVSRWRFLTSTTADNGFTGDFLSELCAQRLELDSRGRPAAVLEEITMDQYRSLPPEDQAAYRVVYGARGGRVPKFFVPECIVKLVNGDNDGDIIGGFAADVAINSYRATKVRGRRVRVGQRVVKLVLIMRYPTIDAPLLWALPAGTPTPFDAPYEEVVRADMTREEILEVARSLYGRHPQLSHMPLEDEAQYSHAALVDVVNLAVNPEAGYYREFLGVFGARIAPDQDLFGDEPVLCTSNLVRLRDRGIKAGFEAKKLEGAISERGALDMVYRKSMLRYTGPYTRKHERLAVRRHFAWTRHLQALQEGNQAAANGWLIEARDMDRRMITNGDAIEGQVSSFKKVLAEEVRSPSLFRYGEDRVFSSKEQPMEAIPIDYHNRIQGLRTVLDDFLGFEGEGESVEAMQPFGPEETRWHMIQGKETTILNRLQETVLGDVVRAMKAIDTSLSFFVVELDRQLEACGLSAQGPIPPDVERERASALRHLELWSQRWNAADGITARYNEILSEGGSHETDEASKRAREYRSRAARVLKDALRSFGATISREALLLAIGDHWALDGHEQVDEETGRKRTTRVNATPALALMGDRLAEIFPLERLRVDVERRKAQAVTVYTTREDLAQAGLTEVPGTTGEPIVCDRIVFSVQDQLFLMQLGAAVLPWRIADGQTIEVDPTRIQARQIIPVTGRRAIVYL